MCSVLARERKREREREREREMTKQCSGNTVFGLGGQFKLALWLFSDRTITQG